MGKTTVRNVDGVKIDHIISLLSGRHSSMEFRIYQEGNRNYMTWNGHHTSGHSSCLGSDVWFRPSSCLVIRTDLPGYTNMKQIKKVVSEMETTFPDQTDWDLYMENCRLVGSTLEELISAFGDERMIRKMELIDFAESLRDSAKLFLTEISLPLTRETEYLRTASGIHLILFKRDGIIKELRAALEYGKTKGVAFHR